MNVYLCRTTAAIVPTPPPAGMSLSNPRLGQCIFCQFRNDIRCLRRIASSHRPSSFSTYSPLARVPSRQSTKKRRDDPLSDAWHKTGQERSDLVGLGSRGGQPSRDKLRGSRGGYNSYKDNVRQNEASRHGVGPARLTINIRHELTVCLSLYLPRGFQPWSSISWTRKYQTSGRLQ